MNTQRIHFIAIGGSVMHNLALALQAKGHHITGSDDAIFEPSKSRLSTAGLLPPHQGWFPEKISKELDAIIVGMHARKDNPELMKARELEIPVYSYAEYIYMQSLDKQRVVIAGSHGKTTITAMIMHVLKYHKRKFDYLIGASLEGFEVMVKLTNDAPVIIIEGDEYPASPTAPKPKFLYYKHHIGLVSGIAWDHVNVYQSENDYVRQFEKFADATPKAGVLVYDDDDYLGNFICNKERPDVTNIPYQTHKFQTEGGQTYLVSSEGKIPIKIFGEHNMKNISGAKAVCLRLGITENGFYEAIASFQGAANRLELLGRNENTLIFKDFAHAPSKLKATTRAVKNQYPERSLVACLELHTFSSLNKDFIDQYRDTFNDADDPIIYFNPKTVEHKKLSPLTEDQVKEAFKNDKLQVFTNSITLKDYLLAQQWQGKNLLLMSSGNFDDMDLQELSQKILAQ